jgi:hypothetical protein
MNPLEKLFIPYKTKFKKIRLGPSGDGGYIVPEELILNSTNLVTFGVGGDINFEKQYAEKYNKNVVCYDQEPDLKVFPEFESLKINDLFNINNKIKYYKTHITSNNINNINFDKNTILKMDIEGCEWDVLRSFNFTENISVLIIEFHINNEYFRTGNLFSINDVILKLNKFMKLIHVHGNNNEGYINNTKLPNVLECTYINKILENNYEIDYSNYPSSLDYPCKAYTKDLTLSWWK